MIAHVREEADEWIPGKTALKVFQIDEFVDTKYIASFFEEERRRQVALARKTKL